ncbi:cupin domain-containing protein [Pseudoruegeria sp. HB172150]|uniref:(R)-mandelonitrile lyase n=1 Tax=Pseudoruegeria sp. HB172150 TaxID=2721164 RepID=UPI00155394C3|nr:cupin domain-containing protein [Pseudoruegeria sp. HB172150]
MDIVRNGERPSVYGDPAYFSGTVRQDPIVTCPEPARARAVIVTFEPGGRTAWHTHPLGQTLHVLSGYGLVQKEGEPVQVIRPGDTVWIPPGERHWHGASPEIAMCHLAIHEALDGKHIDWEEHVTDEEYNAPRAD